MNECIFDYVVPVFNENKSGYKVYKEKSYFSPRYKKRLAIKPSDSLYDGATGAIDINSFGWLFHDVAKRDKTFSCGSVCTNLQASWILHDILKQEKRYIRAKTWFLSTLLWGSIVK